MPREPTPDIVQAARASLALWLIPASVQIAQWALESGWGEHTPLGSNNPFGVKALIGQPSVKALTEEYVNGKPYKLYQYFRKYDSLAQAFSEHAKLLATQEVYAKARAALPNIEAFCDALTGTYATDPKYGTLLRSIIADSNLTQYDL